LTFFQRFYLDDHGLVTQVVLNPPFDELHRAAQSYESCWGAPAGHGQEWRTTNKVPSEQSSQRECWEA
jgi:hypothetical protein